MKKYIFMFILSLAIILYFFVWRIPDFWIKDSFFNTIHYDKKFNSEDNWIIEYKELLSLLKNNKDLIEKFNELWKCVWKTSNCELYNSQLRDKLDNIDADIKILWKDMYVNSYIYADKNLEWNLIKYKDDPIKSWDSISNHEEIFKEIKSKNSASYESYKEYKKLLEEKDLIIKETKDEFNNNFYKIDKSSINKFKILSFKYLKFINKIKDKDFIKWFDENSSIWDSERILSDQFYFIHFNRWIRYLALYENKYWKSTYFLDVILDSISFNTYLYNDGDFDLMWSLVLISNLKINYETIGILLNDTNNDGKKIEKIKNWILNNEINKWSVVNWVKTEFIWRYNWLNNISFLDLFELNFDSYEKLFWTKFAIFGLMFSFNINDNINLNKKFYYDNIINDWIESSYEPPFSFINWYWNHLFTEIKTSYESSFKKEKDLILLRAKIIGKINK